jgi:hypothetical protein
MKTSDLFMNYDLNEAQKQLATKMVSNANCTHTQSINVGWGIVRIGKTKIVTIILAAFLHGKVRTVVCASNGLYC